MQLWLFGAPPRSALLGCLSILLLALTVQSAHAGTLAGSSSDPGFNSDWNGSDILKLGRVWKFKTDPTRTGTQQTVGWYKEAFDDSAWSDLQSGRPWESQGLSYSGYAWYRNHFVIPKEFAGAPLKLTLASIYSDDDVYFNGTRIGGIKGEYKYKNLALRVYVVPTELVHAGSDNTIAIRLWGGRLGFQGAKSGLVAGDYTIEKLTSGLAARDLSAAPTAEKPLELYDLSDAQRGHPFDLVIRMNHSAPMTPDVSLSFRLSDFYGDVIASGTTPIVDRRGSIAEGIVHVDARMARQIYLAGRFKSLASLKGASGTVLGQEVFSADHLSFAGRDHLVLPPLPNTQEATPYGTLKLVDVIDAGTPDDKELHPYLQSAFGVHAQDYMTPGAKADVAVSPILGRIAREAKWSWFAYRVGRGKLVPGHTYLLRISYPEDKSRFAPIAIETGQDYMDVGFKTGVSMDDVYDNWPLSGTWHDYDVVVPLGEETIGTGGAGDGDAANGFWVYFMDQRKPGFYFSDYQGGPAVSTIKLYEIDPKANSPRLTLPAHGLPRRTMTFDWERQPTAPPADIVAYAQLMGYSAVSPTILKWGLTNFAAPVRGYTSATVDDAHYWETGAAVGSPSAAAGPATKSVHEQYLDATRGSGIDYLPRVEYGGSNLLPSRARAIGVDGRPARPDRFASWGADLINPATLQDFKAYLDGLLRPYAATNPQLKGILWRSRQDRLQISYSREDIALFAREAATSPPDHLAEMAPAQAAEWATTAPVAPLYIAWWQKKRAAFHDKVAEALQVIRPDMVLLYFNWDQDKFSLLEPDRLSSAFAARIAAAGGPTAYYADREMRKTYTASDYSDVLKTGLFSGALPQVKRPDPWPDYALLPSLYTKGVQLLAPVPGLPYANMQQYLNYFCTRDGLAVSNIVSYDEIGAREPNPKYEGAMVLPGGAPFSMSVELLSYFYGDVKTLTYTVYTYGRGFADAHRRFASAFRALPAIHGELVKGTPNDVAARTYTTSYGATYLGIAYKGYRPQSLSIDVPGHWEKGARVTNLVTGETRGAIVSGKKLHLEIKATPMELDAYLVQ